MMKRITAAVGLLVVSALALTAPLSATLDDSAARLPEVSDDFIIWHMDCAVIGGSIIIHAHVTCLYWE